MKMQRTSRTPWSFLPTLYFAEGLPYVLINTVSVILYKRMGIDNAHIAFWTSWLYLPWVLKMFWGPAVDVYSTKRKWILGTQAAMSLCMFVIAFSLRTEAFFFLSLAAFCAGAFISATYDIATDGFYMLALSEKEQALFVGLRAGFYRLAMIFGSGFLVYVAGMLETSSGDIAWSWSTVMAASGLIFAGAVVYHKFSLPFPASDSGGPGKEKEDTASFIEVFSAYFRQEKVGVMLAFILFYRLGEAMLLKLVSPFLLDAAGVGGLGLTTKEVGLVYGTVGVLCLVFGGILGGWLISRFGFRRCVWPMVIAMHVPDLFFVYMAYAQPGIGSCLSARGDGAVRLRSGVHRVHGLSHVLGAGKIQDVALRHLDGHHGPRHDAAGVRERLAAADGGVQDVLRSCVRDDGPRHADNPVHTKGQDGEGINF